MKTRNTLFSAAAVALLLGSAFAFGCGDKEDPVPPADGTEEPGNKPDDNDQPGDNDQPEVPDSILVGQGTVKAEGPNYILGFYEIDEIEVRTNKDHSLDLMVEPKCHISYFDNDEEDPEEVERFAEYRTLCERYGDTTYYNADRGLYYMNYLEYFNYLKYNITNIDVVSDADYDADHPAGTSLRDLCYLVTWSPREYIASGYTETYDWSVRPYFIPDGSFYIEDEGNHPMLISLDECTPEDLVLIGNGYISGSLFLLLFKKAPDEGNALQKFTLTLTDERGRIYTAVSDVAEWR